MEVDMRNTLTGCFAILDLVRSAIANRQLVDK